MKVVFSWIAATVTLAAGLCVLGLTAGFAFLLLLALGKPLFVAAFLLGTAALAAVLAAALRGGGRPGG